MTLTEFCEFFFTNFWHFMGLFTLVVVVSEAFVRSVALFATIFRK